VQVFLTNLHSIFCTVWRIAEAETDRSADYVGRFVSPGT